MTDNDNSNISIDGTIQGGLVNIGGKQNVQGNVSITMPDLSQTVQNSPNADAEAKTELKNLLEQLAEELKSIKPEQKQDAENVARRAETLVTEVTAEEPDPDMVKASKSALQKAAENIESVMPTVTRIATQIIFAAAKFYSLG